MTLETEKKTIGRTSLWTMLANGLLAVLKLAAGLLGNSTAMVTDAVNSLSDVVTNLAVMIVGRMSRKEKDEGHPYGHEKFDAMIAVFIGMALVITAFEIGKYAIRMLYDFFVNSVPIATPKPLALIAAVVTIVVKEAMYHLTKRNAVKARSAALHAIALDNRSDVLATSGALIGIGGAMLGLVYLEPLAAILICLFITRLAFKIIKGGFSQVVDEAADQNTVAQIETLVMADPDVKRIDDLKTRQFGMKTYVDIEIAVAKNLSLAAAHKIAHRIHDEVEKRIIGVKHCMVHVNPYEE